jgi:hypothetical protein
VNWRQTQMMSYLATSSQSYLSILAFLAFQLVNLLMREPLARLEVLLFKRCIQDAQSPYLPCARRVVACYLCFGFAVRGLEGEGACGLWGMR